MPSAFPERKPWSMKWIFAAIVVFMAAYTYLTLHYRKPGHAYEPYHDTKTRVNVARLVAAGYQRVELTAQRPADVVSAANNALPAPGGLPEGLRTTLVAPPLLPAEILEVNAATSATTTEPYRIQFRCATPDEKHQFIGAELYVHGDELIVTPNFEPLVGGLQSRTSDSLVVVTVPGGTFKPGSYRVTLAGEKLSRAWTLEVK